MCFVPVLFGFLVLINLACFCLFWWDKEAARRGKWRIPENRLLALAFFGGSPGALIARRVLRHKTRKEPFRTMLLLIAALQIAVLAAWILAHGSWDRIFVQVLR